MESKKIYKIEKHNFSFKEITKPIAVQETKNFKSKKIS